jgi:hypothetical protein
VQRHTHRQRLPELSARARPETARERVALQDRQRLCPPKQRSDRPGIASGVRATAALALEDDLSAAVTHSLDDLPPGRGALKDSIEMATPSDNRHAVEDPPVDLRLPVKTAQCVPVALDLEPLELAIDHGEVDARLVQTQLELVEQPQIRVVGMARHKALLQGEADIKIAQGFGGRCGTGLGMLFDSGVSNPSFGRGLKGCVHTRHGASLRPV